MFVRRLSVLAAASVAALCGCDTSSPSIESSPLEDAIGDRDLVAVEQFLRDGADPNVADNVASPMGMAVGRNDIELLELLLRYGGDASVIGDDGNSLLLSLALDRGALERGEGKPEVAALLVANGADVCVRSTYKDYPGWQMSKVAEAEGELELARFYADIEVGCSDTSAGDSSG